MRLRCSPSVPTLGRVLRQVGLEMAADYSAKLNEMVKVLDFDQLGEPSEARQLEQT